MASISIDGTKVDVREGTSVLEAALQNGIYIPHLCHHRDLPDLGSCRLCIVEYEGGDGPVPSCRLEAKDGMVVSTSTDRVNHLRRLAMELLLAAHPADCSVCPKYGSCEFQTLIQLMGVSATRMHERQKNIPVKEQNLFLHDMSRCVLCGRCVRACADLRGVGVLEYNKREDMEVYVGTLHDKLLCDADCRFCGACAEVCPTGSIRDIETYNAVEKRDTLIPCQHACPAHTDIPRYVHLVAEGKPAQADAVIREKLTFPGVLGHVCNHRCEGDCRRGRVNEPISICKVKRYVASADDEAAWKGRRRNDPPTDKRVAIVGAGPAGMTAAYYLAEKGHHVDVFEAQPKAGGYMQYGIPAFRLPKDVVQSEVADILETGVELHCDSPITNPAELASRYDAALVSTGVSLGTRLRMPGNDATGTCTAIEYMESVNKGDPLPTGRHAFVIGGGSVGFDTARTLLRMGAETVVLSCLESAEQMKATPDEIEEAKEEGVEVHPSKSFIEVLTTDGHVSGIRTVGINGFSFGPQGLELDEVEDSERTFDVDMVVFAVGQRGEDFDEAAGIEHGRSNTIALTDQSSSLKVKGFDNLFAAGDAVRGISFVIDALASGREAATQIDRFLGGDGDISEALVDAEEPNPCIGRIEGFATQERKSEQMVPAGERVRSFDAVSKVFDPATAACEAGRCLQCELRFQIDPPRLWNDYPQTSVSAGEASE
jgi:NADPH-dependent glutamate synthase beta subunit-like oxidoreductase/ferredoxin/Pyruvate/2-oxoacid:ferredoxin oxidoreductase delta subunit